MLPCDWLPDAVTMPAAIGIERFLLIGVASLSHAKAIEPPTNTLYLVTFHTISFTLAFTIFQYMNIHIAKWPRASLRFGPGQPLRDAEAETAPLLGKSTMGECKASVVKAQ